jgi:beta-mannanase
LLLAALATLTTADRAAAGAYLPPAGKLYAGVLAGDPQPTAYQSATGTHAAVFQLFSTWGWDPSWVLQQADQNRSRAMIALQTLDAGGREVISPGAISRGGSDAWLISLGRAIAAHGQPVYVRPLAEMDGYWNPYCAFNANGTARGADHSTKAFRQAWRRMVLILRGGSVASIDATLASLGLPAVHTQQATLARAPVAFLWVPQTAGAPDIAANAPGAYYPGGAYVDWVGTDFYSKFPNFTGLNRFYAQHPDKPFMFGEWALWGADSPSFVTTFFTWIHAHARTRMVIYNEGYSTSGPFRLWRYPKATTVLAHDLASSVFARFAPEWS